MHAHKDVYVRIYLYICTKVLVRSSTLFHCNVSELLTLNVLAFLSGGGLSVKDWWCRPRPIHQLLVTVLLVLIVCKL